MKILEGRFCEIRNFKLNEIVWNVTQTPFAAPKNIFLIRLQPLLSFRSWLAAQLLVNNSW